MLAGFRRMQRTLRTCMFTRRKPQILRNCAQAQILDFLQSRQRRLGHPAGVYPEAPLVLCARAVQESARFRILRTMDRKTSADKIQRVTGTQRIRGSLYSGAARIPAIPKRKTAIIINATAMHNPVESYQGTGAFLNMGPFSVCMISFSKGSPV